VRILAISGSLRAVSSNATALRAVARLAPPGVEVVPWAGLAGLPHFNPDLDDEHAPPLPAVGAFRAVLRSADALILSSPEYAHGVPGSLKNALDWVVGSGELVELPVALLVVAPHATFAQASLVETLVVMSAHLVSGAPFVADLAGRRGITDAEIAADPVLAPALRAMLAAIAAAVEARRGAADGPLPEPQPGA
jgi:NAD(P)H-dependent FMN reductase